jgi:hypothetical protein
MGYARYVVVLQSPTRLFDGRIQTIAEVLFTTHVA